MVEERQNEQNDRVLSSRADFGDRDRSHILGMGATEPPGVYRTSIQSRRGSRTQVTGACERTHFGTGGGDAELTFARTGTSHRRYGLKPTGAGDERIWRRPYPRPRSPEPWSARGALRTTGASSERNLEQAAAIPSSPSLAREPVDRQEVTVSSSPPPLTSERTLEQAAAIPSSPSLAQESVDRQEVTVSSSPPVAGERTQFGKGGR